MAKRSEKNNWKKKRRQEYLEKKEFRYYIFCEGQATEPFYFQGFKQYIEDNPIYRDMNISAAILRGMLHGFLKDVQNKERGYTSSI